MNDKVAVIIEPRKHPLLFKIIDNVMSNLGSLWNLHIFCYDIDYIYSNLNNYNFKLNTINRDNLTEEQYNTLLLSKEFWNNIEEENILIFQTDSFILNKREEDYINEVFIGGVYFYGEFKNINCHMANSPKLHYSINGGFSFRKKSIMLECLNKISISDIITYRTKYKMNNNIFQQEVIPEDLYFQNAIELLNYELPNIDKCNDFCENLSYSYFNLNAFGIHHFDENKLNKYLYNKLIKQLNNIKIIDCFIFYNEFDLLEYRLKTLYNEINYFVIVESRMTFMGYKKKLNFNKEKLKDYLDKIIYIVVDELPYTNEQINNNNQWLNEYYQRNKINEGIKKLNLNDFDLIIISDLDEIPDINSIKESDININVLEQDFYYYNLETKCTNKWYNAKVLNYLNYKKFNCVQDIRINNEIDFKIIKKGGWHLSYFGNSNFIINKIKNFSKQEYNINSINNNENIINCINNYTDLLNNKLINIDININKYLPLNYNIIINFINYNKFKLQKKSKICFITAIYGNYENTCKKYIKQTIDSDFICFTDNTNIKSNGWIIDSNKYHLSNINDKYINSINNNKHTFNIAKYYKQSFNNILLLKDYDIVVWLDGTIELKYSKISEYIIKNIYKYKIIGWHHEHRYGKLYNEVYASNCNKYTSEFFNNQKQPYQDVNKQYLEYIKDGYDELYFKTKDNHTEHIGVWITCFVAFLNKDKEIIKFLNLWYLQTLQYTTQDQISFSYVCQKLNIIPYTLPNNEIKGYNAHINTQFYIKHNHGN